MVEAEVINSHEEGNSLRIEPGYFPEASLEKQMDACRLTVANVILLDKMGESDAKNSHDYFHLSQKARAGFVSADFLYRIVVNNERRYGHLGETERMIASTVALIDTALVDDIASSDSLKTSSFIKRSYYREFGLNLEEYYYLLDADEDGHLINDVGQIVFLTPTEQRGMIQALSQRNDVQQVDDATDPAVRRNDAIWIYPHLAKKEEMSHIEALLMHDAPSLIPFVIDVSVAGFFVQGVRSEEGTFLDLPASELPRQEIYRSFLRSGIPLFSVFDEESYAQGVREVLDVEPDEESMERYKDVALQVVNSVMRWDDEGSPGIDTTGADTRAVHWVRHIGDSNWWPQERLSKKEAYYNRLFGRTHSEFGDAAIALTRSGVSANETGIRAAQILLSQSERTGAERPQAYVLPGWYWETDSVIASTYSPVPSSDDADVVFVNVAPNSPQMMPRSHYISQRDHAVATLKARAASHPDRDFALVVDKTADLTYQSFMEGEILPENLTIFETMSLTKHQRGARNYFYGIVHSWGGEGTARAVADAKMLARGSLTETGIVQLPLLSQHEVVRRTDHFRKIGEVLGRSFEERQANLPAERQWTYEDYGYMGYLVPPAQFILDRLKSEYPKARYLKRGSKAANSLMREFMIYHGISNYYINGKYRSLIAEKDAYEAGDSFGLEKFRLSYVSMEIGKFALWCARFCPGARTTPEEAAWIAGEMSQWLASQMEKFSDPL